MKYNIFFHSLKLQKKPKNKKRTTKKPQKTNKQKNDIFIRFLLKNIRIEKYMQSKFYKLFILLKLDYMLYINMLF